MLANGIKLKWGDSEAAVNEVIKELKEVPEIGIEPEKVENTTLADPVKMYEFGIGDAGELEYKLKYENGSATSSYRKLRAAMEAKAKKYWEQEYPDGTKVKFAGQPSVKISGGGVNSAIEVTLKIALQSELKITDGELSL